MANETKILVLTTNLSQRQICILYYYLWSLTPTVFFFI